MLDSQLSFSNVYELHPSSKRAQCITAHGRAQAQSEWGVPACEAGKPCGLILTVHQKCEGMSILCVLNVLSGWDGLGGGCELCPTVWLHVLPSVACCVSVQGAGTSSQLGWSVTQDPTCQFAKTGWRLTNETERGN